MRARGEPGAALARLLAARGGGTARRVAGRDPRLDHASARLPRALTANAQIHHARFARAAGRLGPQILRARVMRGCELVTALTERAKRAEGIARQRRREQLATATARLSASLRANADAHRSRIGRQGERIAELSERARRAVHSSLSQRAAFVERC